MKKLGVIRLSTTAELGSLEDNNPEKRMTIAHIRKLRRQAHEQTQMKFSMARSFAHFGSFLKSTLDALIRVTAKSLCAVKGHTVRRNEYHSYAPECRDCGVRVTSV